MTPDQLRGRALRFYARYGREIEQIKNLLEIKLRQLALAYTINNRLPQEAVSVHARIKTIDSFLKKLERDGWPDFYYPTEVIRDLIGARMVCWFLDDCYGLVEALKASSHFKVHSDDPLQIRDYIANPQPAGYRAIHLFADVSYDSVERIDGRVTVTTQSRLCEIQVRSKLGDAWGDVTHEFFYKARDAGVQESEYEGFLADIADRLAKEDSTFMKFRDAYQRLADRKQRDGIREGFKDDNTTRRGA
jgi:putative GTP pyrophosphokinase